MARIAGRWTCLLSTAAAVIAFVSLAFEFVAVDADVEPPVVVSASGGVSECERVDGGLLFAVGGGEDALFAVSGGGSAALGYRILAADGSILAEGDGVYVPISAFPGASTVFVFALDGSPLASSVQIASSAQMVGSALGPLRPLRGSSFGLGQPDAFGAGEYCADRNGLQAIGATAFPGLGGTFTVIVSISKPTPDFSIFGISAPGGTTTMNTLPEFSVDGPVSSNVCSVVATGGWFEPPASGWYSFQVEGDDHVRLNVGGVTAAADWPSTGSVASGFFNAGTRHPVSMEHSSIGGPARAIVVRFAEPAYATNGAWLAVSPHNVQFSRKAANGAAAVASIVGEQDPESEYEIVCVQRDEGIAVTGNTATPDANSSYWDGPARTGTVTFALYRDGAEIDRDSAVFTPLPEKAKSCGCDCEEGTTADVGCVEFSQRFGRTPWIAGLPVGRLAMREYSPVARLWTPAALVYDHPMCRRVAVRRDSHPLDVVILDAFGEGTEYVDGRPVNASLGLARGIRCAGGLLVEVMEDRTEITYNADGTVQSIRPPDGTPVSAEDLGIDVFRDDSGSITSIVSRADGRMDVEAVSSNSYRVAWSGPSGAFAKSFTFSGDGQTTFRLHEYRNEQFQFDSEWVYGSDAQDWTLTKAPGTPAAKTWERRISYDAADAAWTVVRSAIDATGGVFRAETSVLDVAGGHVLETGRAAGGQVLYAAVRNSTGTIAADATETGFETKYLYDGWNRLTNETSVVKGGIVRTVSTVYSPDPALDGVVDRRPRRRTVVENGVVVEDEETVYTPNSVGRIRIFGNEERTSLYGLDSRGRIVLSVDETGRAARTVYSAPDASFFWTETRDEGVWSATNGFSTLDGKSTRRTTTYDASGNAVATHDFALVGGEWRETAWATNRYNATHKVVSTLRSDGRTSSADWICTGPVWRIGEDGIATTNAYDAAKALASSVRYGRHGAVTTVYEYDPDGRVIRETDTADGCEARTRAWSYDERGRIVTETDEQGRTKAYAYSADNLVTTVTFPSGGTRITTINPDGSTASVTGTAVTPEYHTYGVTADGLEWEKVTYLSPGGARWEKTYRNGFGDVVREERPGANGSTLMTEYTYNAKGQLVGTTSTGQPAETREYDAWGDVSSVTTAADSASRTVANDWRFTVGRDDPIAPGSNAVWRVSSRSIFSSDVAIAPLVTTNMTQVSGLSLGNESRSVAIDVRGNETETWTSFDPATSTRLSYERVPEASNVALSGTVDGVAALDVSHSAVTNTASYDAYRRPVARIDGRGNTTTNSYDSLGRLASTTDATGATTSFAYDSAGRMTAATNALGIATVYEYDVRGNKTYEGGGTYPVSYAYDAFGVVTNMTTYRAMVGRDDPIAPQGDTTTWLYDEATGLLLSKVYADGNGPSYTYTDTGSLATRTWARGVVTTYSYDGWNNLTNTAYSDGTRPMSFAYDALGRQVYAKDEGGITTTAYDDAGDVASEYTTGRLYTRTLARHRDAYGRETGYSLDNSRKTVVEYEADTGRVRRIQNAGAWFTYYYLPGTDLKSRLQYGGSGSAYYTYEPNRDLLTQVRNHINGGVISQYDYTNDAIGRRTEISRSGSRMSETRTDVYGYNMRDELVSASKLGGPASVPAVTEYSYQYDDIGNRITSLDLGTNRVYSANELNQYSSITTLTSDAGLQTSGFEPQFDLDGNQTLIQTSTGVWQVQYNAENRPVLWTCLQSNNQTITTNQTISMLFDRMGRRVEYVETTGGPGSVPATTNAHHRFVYDGYLCIQRLDALSNNLVELSFAWDPTEPIATRPLVMQRNGGWNFFYTHDGNKNVSDVVSFQQARGVPAHYEYAPFGAVTAVVTNNDIPAFNVATTNPFRFSSEYADDALGLVYYNYRHYNPVAGRWINREPVGESYGVRLYGWLRNGVCFADMLGLISVQPVGCAPNYGTPNEDVWLGVWIPGAETVNVFEVKHLDADIYDCDSNGRIFKAHETQVTTIKTVTAVDGTQRSVLQFPCGSSPDMGTMPYSVLANFSFPGTAKCRRGSITFNVDFYSGKHPANAHRPEVPVQTTVPKPVVSKKNKRDYLLMGSELQVGSDSDHGASYEFWDGDLPKEYNNSSAFAKLHMRIIFHCGQAEPEFDIVATGNWNSGGTQRYDANKFDGHKAQDYGATWKFPDKTGEDKTWETPGVTFAW